MSKYNQRGYFPIDSEQLKRQIIAIEKCWKSFLNEIEKYYQREDKSISLDYTVNIHALREIVERVYQRKDYFMRYHSGMLMSEYKEIGLNMFWISKFKPFCLVGNGYDEKFAFQVNDDFALFYMLTALKNLAKKLNLNYNSDKLSGSLYREMLYCLCFRDIPKEAFGIIVELVANIVIVDLPVQP